MPFLWVLPVLGLAAVLWRWRQTKEENMSEPENSVDRTPPADPQAWKMAPERFPKGVTYEQIQADNARIRQQAAGYGALRTHTSEAGRAASSLLHSMPFGGAQTFEIEGDRYLAIKEWHSPHVPPVGPPHQWHHGISVFQKAS